MNIDISPAVFNALLQDMADLKHRMTTLESHVSAKPTIREVTSCFWQAFHTINGEQHLINHANNIEDEIAINLPELIQYCYTQGIDLPPKKQLIRLIKRERSYLGYLVVRSRLKSCSLRCYVFKRG